MISNRPWNLWHMWCPMLYSVLYFIFNVIYVVAFEGTNPKNNPWIYKILNWNQKPGRSVLMCLALIFVAVPLISVALYFLTKFRDFLWTFFVDQKKKFQRRNSNECIWEYDQFQNQHCHMNLLSDGPENLKKARWPSIYSSFWGIECSINYFALFPCPYINFLIIQK